MNDSKEPHSSNKDRHEKLGQGLIGSKGIQNYVRNEFISTLPMILETPVDKEEDYLDEIKALNILMKKIEA